MKQNIKKLSIVLLLWLFPFMAFSENKDGIKSHETKVYTIQKGDTLYSIGKRFGVDPKELASVNQIKNPSLIRMGQSIVIPISQPMPVVQKILPEASTHPQKIEEIKKQEVSAPDLNEAEPLLVEEVEPQLKPEVKSKVEPASARIKEETSEVNKQPSREYIGAGFGWWFGFLDADAKISLGNVIGTKVDLVNDLGVDDSIGVPVFNLWVQPLSWLRIQGEYMTGSVEGSKDINEDISFHGTTFSIHDAVKSELEIRRFSGWVEINPFHGSWGYVGALVGGEYVELDAKLASDIVGTVKGSVQGGTATLGGQAVINLTEKIDLHGRLRGMSFSISGVDVDVYDMQAGLSYSPFKYFQLSADYRLLWLDVEEENNAGDLTLQGPVISAKLRF